MSRTKSPISFLKTTAIGGLLFLLPLMVLGALVGQVVPILMSFARVLGDFLPVEFKTSAGLSLLFLLAIVVVLLLCFAAGLVARWRIGRGFSAAFERKLAMIFPRYTILKEQMADSIGGEEFADQLKPVLVRLDQVQRVGFETERIDSLNLAVVYLPGAPDAWAGKVVLIELDRITPLLANFGETAATCEQLGRGLGMLLARNPHS